jgi:hypothetical protein
LDTIEINSDGSVANGSPIDVIVYLWLLSFGGEDSNAEGAPNKSPDPVEGAPTPEGERDTGGDPCAEGGLNKAPDPVEGSPNSKGEGDAGGDSYAEGAPNILLVEGSPTKNEASMEMLVKISTNLQNQSHLPPSTAV